MPKEITIMAYKFSELEGQAKERAQATLSEWATEHEWWKCVYESAKEAGDKRGFDIEDIRFSGFWSQGDGASWTGCVKLSRFLDWYMEAYPNDPFHAKYTVLREIVRDDWIYPIVPVTRHSFHYVHSNTVNAGYPEWNALEIELEEENRTETLKSEGVLKGANVYQLCEGIDVGVVLDELHSDIERCVEEFCDEIYKRLEDEYDGITSDEAIAEMAEANEYLFDEDGRVI